MALEPPPPDVEDLVHAPMAISMQRNIPFLQLINLVERFLRIQLFFLFLDAQSYLGLGRRDISHVANAIRIVSILAFRGDEGFCRGGDWVLFGPLQFFKQVIGGSGDHRFCFQIIIQEIDLEFFVFSDEFVEEA